MQGKLSQHSPLDRTTTPSACEGKESHRVMGQSVKASIGTSVGKGPCHQASRRPSPEPNWLKEKTDSHVVPWASCVCCDTIHMPLHTNNIHYTHAPPYKYTLCTRPHIKIIYTMYMPPHKNNSIKVIRLNFYFEGRKPALGVWIRDWALV